MAQYYKMDQERRAKQFAPFAALHGLDEHMSEAERPTFAFPKNQEKIAIIISVNPDGKMLPLWYSYHGMRFKVEKIVWTLEKLAWCQYRCEIYDNDIKKIVDLFYYREITLWTISV